MTLSEQLLHDQLQQNTRRHFLAKCGMGLGALWMAQESGRVWGSGAPLAKDPARPLLPDLPQLPGKAKRVIFMHMAGSPSQLEMWDYKPELNKYDGRDCPESFLKGKQFAFIQGVPKMLGSQYPFHQAGKNGIWVSDRHPHLERMVDDMCIIKSMHTEAINH